MPEPFRPTPLQRNFADHPVVIDFINWPSIRDQMLRNAGYLDLDSMCRDIVLNTVVDLRELGCSVNVHDLLFNYIVPRVRGMGPISSEQSMLHQSSWIYLQVGQAGMESSGCVDDASTDEALARKIAKRICARNSTQLGTLIASNSSLSPRRSSQIDEQALAALLSSFDVHDISRWRLGRDFARKYPYMDCASGTLRS